MKSPRRDYLIAAREPAPTERPWAPDGTNAPRDSRPFDRPEPRPGRRPRCRAAEYAYHAAKSIRRRGGAL